MITSHVIRPNAVQDFDEQLDYYLQPDENTLRIVRVLHGKRDLPHILEEEQG